MTLNVSGIVALIALVLTLMVHTGALLFWGGKVTQMMKDHERRIVRLEG